MQCDIFDIFEIKAIEFKNIESNTKTEFKFLNKTQNINLSFHLSNFLLGTILLSTATC